MLIHEMVHINPFKKKKKKKKPRQLSHEHAMMNLNYSFDDTRLKKH